MWHNCLGPREPGGTKCAGTLAASAAGAMNLSGSFSSLWQLAIKEPLWSFSVALPIHALRGSLWLKVYSVFQCIRSLKGQPLYCSLPMLVCGPREATVMAPSPTHDSAVLPCLQAWFLSTIFSHQDLLPHAPLGLSPHSQWQTSPWDCFTISMV